MATGREQTPGLDLIEATGREREHQIDVVDHEVVHHAHVEGAEGEGGQPTGLQIADLAGPGRSRPPGRIESLHVPHRHNPPQPPRRYRDGPGVFDAHGQWLLDEQVDASLEQRQRDLSMEARGCRHDRRIHPARQLPRVGERLAAVRLRHPVSAFGHRIDHGHEIHVVSRCQKPRVDRAQMPASDHCHPCPCHAALLRSRARPCRPSCCSARNPSKSSTAGASIPWVRRISRACSSPTFAR